MSKVGDHFFEFPASRGTQGGSIVLMLTVPARTLTRVLASDNYGDTLERSQRELNPARAKKFYQYLVEAYENKEPFIIPPLVGNCDSYVEFEEFGNTNVGVARFPMDAEIKLFDGQHRAAGIAEYCRTIDEPIHVPMMLTLQLPLKTRQQFFSDINNNVSKPSAAINMAYNGRDKNAQEMVSFISSHAVFSEVTDFEHNVVPAKSDKWVSFKALSDATAKFSDSCSQDDLEGLWNAWLMLTGLDDIRRGTNQAEYKREYIQFHAVMINAFGYAVQRLSEGRGVRGVTLMIEDLVMNTGIAEREDFFLISSWNGICASCEKTRPTVIANVSSQKAAASRLMDAIVNKNLSVSRGKEASHD
ncbi:TPA: DGQHR domain-containing protein [Klebsiella oxytoca]|uniref:DGQHR domain-containing protein n=1 Tax=Klebsiella oxytoca TaxID=571 RepID=UPI00195E1806|nr:DGQHR domain-containing protein [Klebsiella oxytoca]QRT52596.1 DGQHR domain-containing protein [Klebsiella oxytoca]